MSLKFIYSDLKELLSNYTGAALFNNLDEFIRKLKVFNEARVKSADTKDYSLQMDLDRISTKIKIILDRAQTYKEYSKMPHYIDILDTIECNISTPYSDNLVEEIKRLQKAYLIHSVLLSEKFKFIEHSDKDIYKKQTLMITLKYKKEADNDTQWSLFKILNDGVRHLIQYCKEKLEE